MDNSPYWKKYPKRSKSIVCTNDENVAQIYGNVYVVIPLDKNAKFGICPEIDIWSSFSFAGHSLNDFNSFIYSCTQLTDTDNIPGKIHDMRDVRMILKIFYDKRKDILNIPLYTRIWNSYSYDITNLFKKLLSLDYTSYKDFEKHIFDMMDPKVNDFMLIDFYTNYNKLSQTAIEVWTDSDCVLIKWHEFEEFSEKFDND
jgi:hypothetical protein